MAAPGFSLVAPRRGYSVVAFPRLLIAEASLVANSGHECSVVLANG